VHLSFPATGTGLTTGIKYVLHQNSQLNLNRKHFLGPIGTITVHMSGRIIGQGSAGNFFQSLDVHTTIPDHGEAKITVDKETFECRS